MVRLPEGLYYWEGEKPPALPFEYVDNDGDLIASLAGASSIVAKTKVGTAAEVDVTCTNDGDGTGTIDWPIGASASVFVLASGITEDMMRIDIQVTEGDGSVWYLPRFSVPVRART